MEQVDPSRGRAARRRRGRRRLQLALLLAALIAAAVVLPVIMLRGTNAKTVHGPASAPFTLKLPAHWHAMSEAKLTAANGPAIAGYERNDGKALVVIRRADPLPTISQKFVKSLDAQFKKKLNDYQPVDARIITTKAGSVFFFSYVRRQKGTLDTVVLVPAGDHSFVLDSISNPNSTAAARDVGAIINAFVPG